MEPNSIIIFIIVFCSIFCLSIPADFECDFKLANFWVVGQKYSCEVMNNPQISTVESALIRNIIGDHEDSKSIDDVTFFRADNKGIEYFPRGLEKFFINLQGIVIGVNKLKEIRSSDLKPFPNLTYLNLGENLIQVLEDGVFDYNPELEVLAFWGDKIIHIGEHVFSNLQKLTSLGLGNNVCIVLIAEQNTTAVQNIINKARIQCKNYVFLKLDGKIKGLESDATNINHRNVQSFKQNIYNLECEIRNSKFSFLSSFQERIQKLKAQKFETKVTAQDDKSLLNEVRTLHNELKINTFERFQKIDKDLETTRIDILKSIDLKISELEKRLLDKIEAVLVKSVARIN
ncbi:unnamed protein product [Chironomus riparius]|uniref:Uncharacterized protein n=1 Tax=Chironomus riparius TaxID=315576 RepID=A0A9N9RIT8_9DIPT|nr:unnamed protein product [Chironomus riparius]